MKKIIYIVIAIGALILITGVFDGSSLTVDPLTEEVIKKYIKKDKIYLTYTKKCDII